MRVPALLLFVLVAFFTANATVPRDASALPCDDKCRQRFDFFFCSAGPGNDPCLKFAHETCLLCVFPGNCQDKNDYNILKPHCHPPYHLQPAIYHDECSPICSCGAPVQYQSVEATNSGPATTTFRNIGLCRP